MTTTDPATHAVEVARPSGLAGIPLLALAGLLVGLAVAVLRRLTQGVLAPIVAHLTWSIGMLLLLGPTLELLEMS